MITIKKTLLKANSTALDAIAKHLQAGGALLPESENNLKEVVGILKSYGIVLDAYWKNLVYIADRQFLVLFPFFKYFNGEISPAKLIKHWMHDRINFELAEYTMRSMLWHGGGGLDTYLDSEEFKQLSEQAIQAKFKGNLILGNLHKLFPDFLPEQIRQMCYYRTLGVFWSVMSPMFLELSDRYDRGEIKSIADVVAHVKDALVSAASKPITYSVTVKGKSYDIIPESANLTFLMDAAVPYVEAVFFRSFPFRGTVSYNAQFPYISSELAEFNYGVLYADPLPIGGSGIPPTFLMQDLRHYIPDYLHAIYSQSPRGEDDLRVQICISFQKSMFCVTTAAIKGLAPHPLDTTEPEHQKVNYKYFKGWVDRLCDSRLLNVQEV